VRPTVELILPKTPAFKAENDCPGCGAVVVPSAAMVPSTLGNAAGIARGVSDRRVHNRNKARRKRIGDVDRSRKRTDDAGCRIHNDHVRARDADAVEYGDERDPKMREFMVKIAPVNNARKITKPLFVVQGKNDPRVPFTEAEQMVKTVRENGSPVWYPLAKDEGHGFAKKKNAGESTRTPRRSFRHHSFRIAASS
jgi:hypothetical protein